MKKFIIQNWYKLMLGASMMMLSFGFMIYSLNSAVAGNNGSPPIKEALQITQFDNKSSVLTVKLIDSQFKELIKYRIQDVNLIKLNNKKISSTTTYFNDIPDTEILNIKNITRE